MKRSFLSTVLALALAAFAGGAGAQDYPTKPVRIIVPQAAGGGTDNIARIIAEPLSKQLGQSFVVENRTGAGTLVGTEAAAASPGDGYTLVVGLNASMAVNPALYPDMKYDPIKDFIPVSMLATYPFLVVVNKDLPVKNIKELIDYAKARPGKINYASAGNGTGQHLSMELFKVLTGTDLVHVPYKGAQAAYIDVISGQVPVFFDNISAAVGQVKGGAVKALAVTTKTRSPVVPDVPTVDESGLPGFEYATWFGLWAPKGTPLPIVEKLYNETQKAMKDPAVRKRITDAAGEPNEMKRADIEPFVKAEIVKWAEVVKKANVKPD